jgi:K+-sensing histidine kinase KdpD
VTFTTLPRENVSGCSISGASAILVLNNGPNGSGGRRMSVWKGAVSVTVTLAVMSAVTAILWYFKLATFGPAHPVFFYLLPIGLVMILYGSLPALLAVFTAAACADFFLYEPLYSFEISTRTELGDLACFSLLALMGVKCASELFRPSEKVPAAKSRYGRL